MSENSPVAYQSISMAGFIMLLKDIKVFKLPKFQGGSYTGMDRLEIPLCLLVLKKVTKRDDNGDIELICQAKDGPEEKHDWIHFNFKDKIIKDKIYEWFVLKIGWSMENILNSSFSI